MFELVSSPSTLRISSLSRIVKRLLISSMVLKRNSLKSLLFITELKSLYMGPVKQCHNFLAHSLVKSIATEFVSFLLLSLYPGRFVVS